MSPSLALVPNNPPPAKPETVATKVRRLQDEAKTAARDHIGALLTHIAEVEKVAAEIAAGGDVYPVGARNVARQLVADCASRAETLGAIMARAR